MILLQQHYLQYLFVPLATLFPHRVFKELRNFGSDGDQQMSWRRKRVVNYNSISSHGDASVIPLTCGNIQGVPTGSSSWGLRVAVDVVLDWYVMLLLVLVSSTSGCSNPSNCSGKVILVGKSGFRKLSVRACFTFIYSTAHFG